MIQNRKHYACATCSSLPADRFINESIIWKMNSLVDAETSIKFKSVFLHK